MALFKILRGKEANLPSTITDGNIYFCKDTKNYYIDYNLDGTLTRSKIAAGYADMLRYKQDGSTIEIEPSTILTDSNYATKIGAAATNKAGLMSSSDKTKLDGIATGANKTVVDSALSSTSENPVENKVIKAALDKKAGLDTATSAANGLMSSTDKSKLDDVAAGAEVNQNAYSKITVGTTEITATSKTDNITVVAGNNVTLTPDASNKKYTISAKDTTYPIVSASADGLMSKKDKAKLDGISEEANKYELPTASDAVLGGIKVGTNLSIDANGVLSATDTTYGNATTTEAGLMSGADKTKLDSIETGAQANVQADYSQLDETQADYIKNKIVGRYLTDEIAEKVEFNKDLSKYYIYVSLDFYSMQSLSGTRNCRVKIPRYSYNETGTCIINTYESGGQLNSDIRINTSNLVINGVAMGSSSHMYGRLYITNTNDWSLSENTPIYIYIDGYSEVRIQQLDEQYIPDTIARTDQVIPFSQKGTANGVATLDENGIVPSAQLPSYVDDVIEAISLGDLPPTGESGKIYVTTADNLTYRWSGSTYVEISKSLALGTTSSTAAAGNHIHNAATTSENGFMSAEDKAKLDGIAANANNYSLPKASASTLGGIKVGTNLSIDSNGVLSATDTTYATATTTTDGLMSKSDKSKLDGIAEGANKTTVDSALSDSSTNPVQNKIVKAALDGKSDSGHTHTQYENQNAFGIIKIGADSVEADQTVDTIEFEAGSNVTITPNATAGKIVIAAKDTTYPVATESANGLMSSADKTKLDGVATGAQVNVIEGVTSNSLSVGSITDKKVQLDIEWIEF